MTWMTAVRDHPERPPAMQCHVLNYLALRMDWQTGAGFASTGQLAADAAADERTVRRATKWGRENDMLAQTRRGHRVTSDRVVASEWRLTLPGESQQDTGVRLEGKPKRTAGRTQPDRDREPTGQRGRPNRTPQHHHQELGPQDLVPSANGDGAKAPRPPSDNPETPSLPYVMPLDMPVHRLPPAPCCQHRFTMREYIKIARSAEDKTAADEGRLLCGDPGCGRGRIPAKTVTL